MKVGVLGLGYWGPQIVRNLSFLELCDQVVVCDIDESKVKAVTRLYPSAASIGTVDDLLADPDLFAIVIATPVTTHFDLARRAIEAGKHVLVEKPITTSHEDARTLTRMATESNVLVMAAHTFLYSPPVQVVRDAITNGEIGTPLYVQSSRVNLGIHQSDVSVIWDLAPHDLSILCYWLGEVPMRVSATGRSSHGVGPADVAFVDLEFPSGCIANLHLSWLAPTKVRRMTLVGSQRMVVYEDTNYEEPVKFFDKGVHLPDPEDFGQFKATYRLGDVISPRVETWEPLRAQLEDFLARASRGEAAGAAEDTAVEVVRVAEAAEHSLANGGRVIDL